MRKTFLALLFDYLPHFLASETEGFWKKVAEGSSARVEGRQAGQGGSSAVNAEPFSGVSDKHAYTRTRAKSGARKCSARPKQLIGTALDSRRLDGLEERPSTF